MRTEDMEKVAKIALSADNWCDKCANDLFYQLSIAFPEHRKCLEQIWERRDAIESAYAAALNNDVSDLPNVWQIP